MKAESIPADFLADRHGGQAQPGTAGINSFSVVAAKNYVIKMLIMERNNCVNLKQIEFMGKRQINQAPPIQTELTIHKEEFKKKLSERVEMGQQLFEREIQNNQELEILKREYEEWDIFNSEYLKYSFNKPQTEYKEAYDMEGYTFLGRIGEYKNEVEDYKDRIYRRTKNLKNLINITDLLRQSETVVVPSNFIHTPSTSIAKDEVFIVHGHDEVAKIKTARFIERLGFKPIILHEQASSGKTVIEKIEVYSNVGFGIVLYTPCDIGGKDEKEPILRPRGRQNVVFEHGYLIGKIGRCNVCALVKGSIETPTDISGVVYISMDDSDAWHIQLAKELKKSGYNVDMNKAIV